MNYSLFYGLLLVHLLVDLVFQTDREAEQRLSSKIREILISNIKHALIHALLSVIVILYFYRGIGVVIPIIIICILHFTIDILKSILSTKCFPSFKYNPLVFVIDQLIHIAILFALTYGMDFILYPSSNKGGILASSLQVILTITNIPLVIDEKLILFFILWIIGLYGAGIFIRIYIQGVQYRPYRSAINKKIAIPEESRDNGIQDGGFIIGILERVVIIFAVAADMVSIIGFLIATKSIARFKKFEDDSFVEYFIIGSFLSIFIGIIIGFAIKQMGLLPY